MRFKNCYDSWSRIARTGAYTLLSKFIILFFNMKRRPLSVSAIGWPGLYPGWRSGNSHRKVTLYNILVHYAYLL